MVPYDIFTRAEWFHMIFHSCIVVYLLSNQNCFVISDTFSCDQEVIDKKGDSGPFLGLHQHMSVRVPYMGQPTSCDFRARKDSKQDEKVQDIKFVNWRKEMGCFSETLLNN